MVGMNIFLIGNEMLLGCISRLLQLDRTQKIMLALQDKDSLLQYLTNVPVGLMPEVMAFPLQQDGYQCENEHLNIVYSTMRWWNMPMLYSYHNCVKSDAKRKRNDYKHDVCM
jgi:spore coat polysaccharide biosynthesis protein SpsF (cytidylyltransferase family)